MKPLSTQNVQKELHDVVAQINKILASQAARIEALEEKAAKPAPKAAAK